MMGAVFVGIGFDILVALAGFGNRIELGMCRLLLGFQVAFGLCRNSASFGNLVLTSLKLRFSFAETRLPSETSFSDGLEGGYPFHWP